SLLLVGAGSAAQASAPRPAPVSAPATAVTIPSSSTTPTVDGNCSEYGDANSLTFPDGPYTITAYLKHNIGDIYICLLEMPVPDASVRDGPNAAIYLDRTGLGGTAPNSDTFSFSVSYSGTVRGVRGGSSGYNGPAPISPDQFMAARSLDG